MKLATTFVVIFLFVGINAKTCLEQVKELSDLRPLLGAYKPVCQPNGLFAETQCHAGYCYCVVPKTGEEILGTRIRFNRPKSCKATPCLMQRSEGLLKSKKGMVGHFQPQCEEDGSFKKIQCHGSTGYCYCVAPETGEKVEGTEVRGMPATCETTGVNNAKKCMKELNELQAKPKLLGAFKPVCQSNGLYAETQCHASYCYCVVPATGKEIMGTRIRFNRPKTCKATPCLMQRSEGLLKSKKGMVGHFQPQCEEGGSFKKIQCHGSTGFCFCVSTETGEKVEGTEVRGMPTNCETTGKNNEKKCLKHVKSLQSKPKMLGRFNPVCQANGQYAETQCHEGYCYCVVPATGEEILGTRIRFNRPETCKATPCFMKRHHSLKDSAKGMTGQFQPSCNKDGSFTKTQCHSSTGFCFCVISETGEKVLGTEVRFKKPKTCELTECMHQRSMAMRSRLMGIFTPTCDEDGAYTPTQCQEGFCYCVFPETGKEVLGTRLLSRGQKPVSCEITKCVQKRHEYLGATKPLLGAFKPECTANGTYNPVQCHEGICHCVFPGSGEEVLGTMTRFSKPKSCKLTPCVLARHKGWKMSSLGLLGVPIKRCNADGKFQKVQCLRGMCWCVDPNSGKPIAGKSAQWSVPNCS